MLRATSPCYLIAILEEVASLKFCILLKHNNKILSHAILEEVASLKSCILLKYKNKILSHDLQHMEIQQSVQLYQEDHY